MSYSSIENKHNVGYSSLYNTSAGGSGSSTASGSNMAKGVMTANQALASSSWLQLTDNWEEKYDDEKAFDTTDGTWTCPETAKYLTTINTAVTPSTTNSTMHMRIYDNAVANGIYSLTIASGNNVGQNILGEGILSLTSGDELDIRASLGGTNRNIKCVNYSLTKIDDTYAYSIYGGTFTLPANTLTYLDATSQAGSITTVFDTASAFDTTNVKWVCPSSGTYNTSMSIRNQAHQSGTWCYYDVMLNATTIIAKFKSGYTTQGGGNLHSQLCFTHEFNENDEVSVRMYITRSSGNTTAYIDRWDAFKII